MERQIKEIYRLVRSETIFPDIYLGIPSGQYGQLLSLSVREGKVLVRTLKDSKGTYKTFSSFDEQTKRQIFGQCMRLAMDIYRTAPTLDDIMENI